MSSISTSLRNTVLALMILVPTSLSSGDEETPTSVGLPPGPSFKEVLSVAGAFAPRISPAGDAVVYTVTRADWDENRYDTEIWLARDGEEPFPLTRTSEGSSESPRWSPDGRWIAFAADRGNGRQINVLRAAGGEARPLTAVEDGVGSFEFSADGRHLAVLVTEPASDDDEKREELYGEFAVEDHEFKMTHLWVLDVAAALETEDGAELPSEEEDQESEEDEEDDDGEEEPSPWRRLTHGDDFTVIGVAWSPDSRRIAFTHQPDPTAPSFNLRDLSIVDVDSGSVRELASRPGLDGQPIFSPDGEWVLFPTNDGQTAYYINRELAKVPANGGEITVLTRDFDENPSAVAWLDDGIYFLAFQQTRRQLLRLDPTSGAVTPITGEWPLIWSAHFTRDGRAFTFVGEDSGQIEEIYLSSGGAPRRLTSMSDEVADWDLGSREVISWKSEDGAPIEGVLWKPSDFDSNRRYPLLVVIHGGPASISLPVHLSSYVYPIHQWLAKGAVVMMPNYRGSTGYGADFRALNVRNLGVGDAWDVLSGVRRLVDAGIADPDKMGAMGWSQGGYISAFLTTTSDVFQAISVGAGISNWMTYYVNTDIHPFTRHYLEANPWDDPEIYAKTSPMTYIKDAKTPTLIQHGEFDRRVPIPNAYELFQGLEDQGVPTRLVVYKGFGHGISKPKERLAALWHNWQWFAEHLWGETVELPLE